MKARLNAVQHALWALVLASLVLGVVAFPRGHNREYTAALEELTAFRDAFKQSELEKSLLDYARAQGTVQLAEVATRIEGPRVPRVRIASKAPPPIQPLAEIHLRTLAETVGHARPEASLPIGRATPTPLAAAVAWRLARRPVADGATPPALELERISLEPAQFTAADIALEAEIGQLRLDTMAAERATADATKKLTTAEEIFEARRKRRLPWKILVKADEARKEAKAVLDEKQRTLDETRGRYESAVERAEATAAKPAAASGSLPGTHALARVELREASQTFQLRVPIELAIHQAKLPPLAGTEFKATREAGLWNAVKDGTADAAIDLTRSKFTWHYRYAEIAGLRIGGMTVLQILPLLLPLILFLLLSRIRHVSGSYNPFGTTLDQKLPRVGLGSRPLELGALVLLPLAAVVLTAVALWAVSQAPVVPALAAVAALGLGAYAFIELGSLQALIEAVVRSHSNPPAKPGGESSL